MTTQCVAGPPQRKTSQDCLFVSAQPPCYLGDVQTGVGGMGQSRELTMRDTTSAIRINNYSSR